MKRIAIALTVAVVACGVAYGQDKKVEPNENLKCYGLLVGTWRYEGPQLEDVEDMGKEGDEIVVQFSWRRILDGAAIENNWFVEFKGGTKSSGKSLIGWDAGENQIVSGGMDSRGGIGHGTVVFDDAAKTFTNTGKGTDGDGKQTSGKNVVTKTGKDTLTWQALERTGGLIEGASPVYTFKRVKRERKTDQPPKKPKQPVLLKQAK